jgi:hypothetical protein
MLLVLMISKQLFVWCLQSSGAQSGLDLPVVCVVPGLFCQICVDLLAEGKSVAPAVSSKAFQDLCCLNERERRDLLYHEISKWIINGGPSSVLIGE